MRQFPSLGEYDGQFVHPRIAVGGCPRPPHVPALVAAGIRGVIDARSVYLKEHVIYLAHLPEHVHWMLLGTWDGVYINAQGEHDGREPARPVMDRAYASYVVEHAARIVRDHWPVLIHCGGGIGRSGNLAGVVYAALEEVSVDEAIRRMRAYRPVLADWDPHRWQTDGADLVELARSILNR